MKIQLEKNNGQKFNEKSDLIDVQYFWCELAPT